MAENTFYRFELSFEGEEQGVGILQGLSDTPVDLSIQDELYGKFDSLPVPPALCTEDDSPVVCYFTKKGLIEFADAINAMLYELSGFNWQVIGKAICVDDIHAIYSDEYQVAFSRTDILELTFFDDKPYKEVALIDPTCNDLIVFRQTKHTLEEKIRNAQADHSASEPIRQNISIER